MGTKIQQKRTFSPAFLVQVCQFKYNVTKYKVRTQNNTFAQLKVVNLLFPTIFISNLYFNELMQENQDLVPEKINWNKLDQMC